MLTQPDSPCESLAQMLSEIDNLELDLESTLEDLTLYDFQIECNSPGQKVARAFSENPLLPGVILTEEGQFAGMISRRRFLEHISRPYGLELFLNRPIKVLYRFAQTDVLIFPSKTLIVMAARRSLQRPSDLLYEPVVVEISPQVYRLLDVHQLLVAQSHIHEITARLLREQTKAQMLQTEKMASLGRMVAGVAHEIKNPVNCISGNMGFLFNYCSDLMELLSAYQEEVGERSPTINEIKQMIELDFLREDLPKILESIRVSAERLTKIVGGLQNFSHMDEGKRQPADIHECIDSTLLILHNRLKYGIEVVKKYGNLPPLECYSGQLSQVFMNLLSNAIDALMEKSEKLNKKFGNSLNWKPKIEIITEFIELPNPHISIRIIDNGPGIPPEIQGRIFETFFTTKPVGKGTGLGLAISHEIVTQKHGGCLNLRSTYSDGDLQSDTGTEFEIQLPLQSPPIERSTLKEMIS